MTKIIVTGKDKGEVIKNLIAVEKLFPQFTGERRSEETILLQGIQIIKDTKKIEATEVYYVEIPNKLVI